MILAEVRCPRKACGKVKKYLIYKATKKSDLYNKSTTCYHCGMRFKIVGPECNRVVRILKQTRKSL